MSGGRRAALLAFLVGLLPAPTAHAATISFDDLTAPGRGGNGLPVNVQYENEGVTFNEPSALDFSKGEGALPGFTHSGNVAVEACLGAEFCKAPIETSFTVAQQRVKVWIGFDTTELAEPLGVRLTGYDASSAVVGSDEATLPVHSGPTPIQTPLEIEPGSPRIRKIAVSVTTGGGYSGGLALDDLEFSTVGPPPPCGASGAPEVVLDTPPSSLVNLNEFPLSGKVTSQGAPITAARVVDTTSSEERTSSAFPALIHPEGGKFGPVRYNGLLSPGANDVVVKATNCRGTGTSGHITLVYSPISPATVFHQLGMIEVSQSVQDTNNTVPLIAATPAGAKVTYARVFLNESGTPGNAGRISGTLTAQRPDGSRPPGPLRIHSLNQVFVSEGQTLEGARASLATSLNFELPPEWQGAGPLHLQLEHLEIEGTQLAFPCEGCDNPGVKGPAVVHFHSVPPLHIVLIDVPYEATPNGVPFLVSPFHREMLASWLRRAYPSADIEITEMTMPTQPEQPGALDEDGNRTRSGFLCEDLNSRINHFVSEDEANEPLTRFYGMVSDEGNHFMRGCSEIGGQVGSGPAGSGTFGWDTDGSYADWYGGHEIGHMFGRLHPGDCKQASDDHSYPYPGGLIGDSAFDPQMLDTGDAALGGAQERIPPRVGDWRTGWHDVMTYCEKEWLSDYTYRGILANSCGHDHAQCSDFAQLSEAGRPRRGKPRRGAKQRLLVSGSLELRGGHVSLDPLSVRRGLKLSGRPGTSPYAIELRGPRGRLLGRYAFAPRTLSDQPRGAGEALINEVVPWRRGTTRIEIAKGGRALTSVRVSAHAPTVEVTSARRDRKRGGEVELRWRSHDRDGGRRTYSVLYRPSPNRSIPVATGLRRASLKVPLRGLPGGSHARFEVVVSDGVLTGSDRTPSLRVPFKAPRVTIEAPTRGGAVPAEQPLTLRATVADLQDPRMKPSQIVWRSPNQGVLGKGASIVTTLKPGHHEISVTATDSGGRASAATVEVQAEPIPPVVQAEPTG